MLAVMFAEGFCFGMRRLPEAHATLAVTGGSRGLSLSICIYDGFSSGLVVGASTLVAGLLPYQYGGNTRVLR
jgi:hypothetical protein